MIKFNYISISSPKDLEIIADDSGRGVIIVNKENGEEISISELNYEDQSHIKLILTDWVNHYKAMREDDLFVQRPENDQFGTSYIRGLNEDMGK